MKFTVYCHEIISGSDVGLYFSASLEQSIAAAENYRSAYRIFDPAGPPLGTLAIYEMVLRMPGAAAMIDVLNSPESLLPICLKSRRLVAESVD
ncbi:hypothetical protein GOD83_06800 [Sinorhizobium medicae]|nr:hypothetical protein [Sinorhizobium medicae]MDX0578225.1 hypothetical protein [Sinorhizobium medicae]MDX0780063.1 hypothetical protein [Sinorhizobium medicae]